MPISTELSPQDRKWKKIRQICKKAADLTRRATEMWAEAAYKYVSEDKHADWRWLLADMRNRCLDEGIDCPYTVTYLVVLAEAYEAVDGDFDRGVPVSVLIEGRNLDNLLDIIADDPKMTVARMKAIVAKDANEDDERSVDEIEADTENERKEKAAEAKAARQIKKIENWDTEKADELLSTLRREAHAYHIAIVNLVTEEGFEFSEREVAKTLHTLADLTRTLEEFTTPKRRRRAA